MKSYFKSHLAVGLLIVPLSFLMSSCFLLRPSSFLETCGVLQAEDTVRYAFTFYPSGIVKEISTFVKGQGWWGWKGYHYTFYTNGLLKEITYFEKGAFSPFVIGFNEEGKLTELTSNSGKDMLDMIQGNVANSQGQDLTGILTVGDWSPNGQLRVHYDINTGEITKIEENDSQQTGSDPEKGTTRYWIYKSGLELIMGKKGVVAVRSYKENKRIGENLVFDRKGKLEKFYYKGANALGIAFKVKDLRKVVDAKPCNH